jgi:alanine-alpha-ketoisovalerate/valine-pyruvate aminotransferase
MPNNADKGNKPIFSPESQEKWREQLDKLVKDEKKQETTQSNPESSAGDVLTQEEIDRILGA